LSILECLVYLWQVLCNFEFLTYVSPNPIKLNFDERLFLVN